MRNASRDVHVERDREHERNVHDHPRKHARKYILQDCEHQRRASDHEEQVHRMPEQPIFSKSLRERSIKTHRLSVTELPVLLPPVPPPTPPPSPPFLIHSFSTNPDTTQNPTNYPAAANPHQHYRPILICQHNCEVGRGTGGHSQSPQTKPRTPDRSPSASAGSPPHTGPSPRRAHTGPRPPAARSCRCCCCCCTEARTALTAPEAGSCRGSCPSSSAIQERYFVARYRCPSSTTSRLRPTPATPTTTYDGGGWRATWFVPVRFIQQLPSG